MVINSLAHFFSRLSLKRMFLLCLLCFIFIPFASITTLINYKASIALHSQVHDNILQVLVQTAKNVSLFIKDIDAVSVEILGNADVQHYLIEYRREEPVSETPQQVFQYILSRERLKHKILEWVSRLILSKQRINSICISDKTQNILWYGETIFNENTPYHRAALVLNGKPVWTPPYLEYNQHAGKDQLVLSCIRQIRDLNDGTGLAVMRLTFTENTLSDMYASNSGDSADHQFILDRSGRIVSSPNKTLINQSYESINHLLRHDKGSVLLREKRGNKLLFYAIIADTDWILVRIIPETILLSSSRFIRLLSVSFLAILLSFGVLFIAIQNRCVVQPLVHLSGEMEKVKNGFFDLDIDITSKNEIGELTFLFLDMTDKLRELFETVYKAKLHMREAELRALQSQISPHFLYNTLDSIYWLAYRNKDFEVGRQVEALSNLFRHVLNSGNEMTTVEKELEHLRNYLYILKSRIGERIRLIIDVDEHIRQCWIIKLILQPLVENSVYHGLECKHGEGLIRVSIQRQKDVLVIKVLDNGLGADEGKIRALLSDDTQSEQVFALKNISQRIRVKYGEKYGLQFYSYPDCGTKVVVKIPLIFQQETRI